jgi:hypothetical protein
LPVNDKPEAFPEIAEPVIPDNSGTEATEVIEAEKESYEAQGQGGGS